MSQHSYKPAGLIVAPAVICATLLSLPAFSVAQSPTSPGTTTTIVSGSVQQSHRLSAGPDLTLDTAQLRRVSTTLDLRYSLSHSWEALLQIPTANITQFDGDDAIALSHAVAGARVYLATSETDGFAMTFHSSLLFNVPVMPARTAGEVFLNDDARRSNAPIADGLFGFEPRFGLTIQMNDVQIEVETGILVRTQAVNRFDSRLSARIPLIDQVHLEGRITSSLAQDPRPAPGDGQPPILSATGIGEFTERVAFTLQASYEITPRFEWGAGVLLPIQQIEYPVGPALVGFVRYNGFHPSPASQIIDQ